LLGCQENYGKIKKKRKENQERALGHFKWSKKESPSSKEGTERNASVVLFIMNN